MQIIAEWTWKVSVDVKKIVIIEISTSKKSNLESYSMLTKVRATEEMHNLKVTYTVIYQQWNNAIT